MKQQLKIMIVKNGNANDFVWVTLPTLQKDFSKVTMDAGNFKIMKVCCNNYTLSQAMMHCEITSENLSLMNYLGEIFSGFDKSQRTLFGLIADQYLCTENPLDDFVNLAINVKNNNPEYVMYTFDIPQELKLRIRRKK